MKNRLKILTIISIILLCTSLTIKQFQNDTFYMIKLGNDILKSGIELKDKYCWITNLDYTYPHWLYDVLLAIIYNKYSYAGIYITTIIEFIILIITIYKININTNKKEFLAFLISILSIFSLYPFVTARSHLITTILYIWQVYSIEKLIETGNKKYIFQLLIISLLIANIHATIWMFTFILYLPYLINHIVYIVAQKKNIRIKKIIIEKIKNIKLLVLSFFLSFLIGILSPSRICYTYIFKIMQGNSQQYILEHASMILIDHPIFIAICLVLLIILIFSNTKVYLKELFMICGLILMSLISIRHLIFFYTIGVLYISIICNRYLTNNKDKTLEILGDLLVTKKIIYYFVLIMIILISGYKFNENYKKSYVPKDEYPVEVVNFIKKELELKKLKLYNHYNYGSYLMYKDIPIFIDSRCDLYLPEFNGLDYNIFEDAMNINKNYKKTFEFYNVSHVLIKKDDLLYNILNNDNNYKTIYVDKNFVLFERKNYE